MAAREKPTGPGERESRPAPSSIPANSLDALVAGLADLDVDKLRLQWRNHLGGTPPAHLPRWLLARILAQRIQIATLGDHDKATLRVIRQSKNEDSDGRPFASRKPATKDGIGLKSGALLVREWNGALQRVMVLEKGFAWNGKTYGSLSQIAKAMTGTSWNGHRFFGLRPASQGARAKTEGIRSIGRAKGRLKAARGRENQVDECHPRQVAGTAQGVVAHEVVAAVATATSPAASPALPPSRGACAGIRHDRPEASP
jgi:Protein of unknown function (DUF2924)